MNGRFDGCVEYSFPPWLPVIVKVLWVMFAFQACVAIWLTYYFWSNQAYRQAVFKFSPRTSAEEKDYRLKYFAKKEVADTDLVYGHKDLVIIF